MIDEKYENIASMMPLTYRKKPVDIQAIKWNGSNFREVQCFAGDNVAVVDGELIIKTLEDGKDGQAKHAASVGDFVIRGIKGEFYFCKPDIFEDTYELIPSDDKKNK